MGQFSAPISARSGLHVKDDFIIHEGVLTNTIGDLRWAMTTIGNASTASYPVAAAVDAYGILKDTTAATADGDGEVYTLGVADEIVLGAAGGRFSFKARLADQIASNNFRIGLVDVATAGEPTIGIYAESDGGVLSLSTMSAGHGDNTAAAARVGSLTSGTTMVLNTWTYIDVLWFGENAQGGPANAQMWVDGYLAAEVPCNIDDDERMEFSIIHWQDSGGALAVELDLDFIELFIGREQ